MLRALVHDERTNAVVGWALVGAVALVAVERLLAGELLWAAFLALFAVVAAAPALATGEWTVMVPWPLLAVGAGASVVRSAGVAPETAGFAVVAMFALVGVFELDTFTPVDMSRRFAVGFAVMTTMAVQAVWTVAQFYADRWLGTDYLHTQVELQWDIVAVTVVALVAGGFFVWYFDRFEHVGSRRRPPGSFS